MSVFNSITKSFVVLVLTLILLALVAGLQIAGSEIFKPYTAPAEAEAMHIRNQADAKIAAVQVDEAAKIAAAETEADVARIRAEAAKQIAVINAQAQAEIAQIQEAVRMEKARNDQALANEANWAKVAMTLVLAFGLAVCVALAKVLLRLSSRVSAGAQIQPMPGLAPKHDLWEDEDYKSWRIQQARQQEYEHRQTIFAWFHPTPRRRVGGNGHRPASARTIASDW